MVLQEVGWVIKHLLAAKLRVVAGAARKLSDLDNEESGGWRIRNSR